MTKPPRYRLDSLLGIGGVAGSLVTLATLLGCNQQQQQDLPNRVLDRPTDLALVCAQIVCEEDDAVGDAGYLSVDADECRVATVSLNLCSDDTGSCDTLPTNYESIDDPNQPGDRIPIPTAGSPHLIGFVTNSERNEIAMFTRCSNELVDMNVATPGYNFVPAGVLPTRIASSVDGCRVASTNAGSCDLTLLDGEGLSAFGLGLAGTVAEPSSMVATIVPRYVDQESGTLKPLGARPSDIILVPESMTSSPSIGGLAETCELDAPASAYVSFPACNLVAEVDLVSGQILQHRKFEVVDGEVTVDDDVDFAQDPCPVECPSQFEVVPEAATPPADSPFPQALELLVPVDDTDQDADRSLFVGGLGSDSVFELRIGSDGTWLDDWQQLELEGASGVSRIRVSPVIALDELGEEQARFLYVIVGDGSTRVVQRQPDVGVGQPLGIECDTQPDPTTLDGVIGTSTACIPVEEGSGAQRRALVGGPGIRAPGADVVDWAFVEVGGEPGPNDGSIDTTSLFAQPGGVFAVGATTTGRLIYVLINQSRVLGDSDFETLTGVEDPADIMNIDLFPHSLWEDPARDKVPLVSNQAPDRTFPVDYGPARLLSPSLRQIDATYLEDPTPEDEKQGVPPASKLDNHTDGDRLGGAEYYTGVEPLYTEPVARVATHDYRSWGAADWQLEWEGIVVGTSSTGRVVCESPGWEGGTCLVAEADDARIHDSGATFCEDGVLAGDKLVILGCTDDDQCGAGRRCLREVADGGESSGICVSEQAYDESASELRVVCDPFLRDPCGEAHREYTITKAFQDELWIQAMDIPAIATLKIDEAAGTYAELERQMICAQTQPEAGCVEDVDCAGLDHEGLPVLESGNPEFAWECVEERCRRACEDPSECMLRPLPGPACFAEFVPYQVRLRNAFLVDGPVRGLDPIIVDELTGECVRRNAIDDSTLLTSRIPLPASNSPDDPDWNAIPICDGDLVLPTSPNPCRIQSTSPDQLFHRLAYGGQTVDAIRYSNPVFSIVLDLTSLETLVAPIPEYEEFGWPAELAAFKRSRIPRGYQQEFGLESGYIPMQASGALNNYALTLPTRVLLSPETNRLFIVDGAGPGTNSGIRGQVVLFDLVSATTDISFDGVR